MPNGMWHPMTIEEYAELEAAHGADVFKVDGVWWRCVRPFFYQPLFPFLEIVPHTKRVPHAALLGGFQHLVPSADMANSRRHYFVWDDFRRYSLGSINHQRRYNIKRGMRHYEVREVDDIEAFIDEGHAVYRSFYERTKYRYKKERYDRRCFAGWAQTLFLFPKVKILGAYRAGTLSAISISYLVNDVLIEASCFGKTEDLKDYVLDALAHGLLERAASCPDVGVIFRGAATGVRGVDGAKLQKGCRLVSKPAFYRMNTLLHFLLKGFMSDNYRKLTGSLDGTPGTEGANPLPPCRDSASAALIQSLSSALNRRKNGNSAGETDAAAACIKSGKHTKENDNE